MLSGERADSSWPDALTEGERHSAAWEKIAAMLTARLAALREQNDRRLATHERDMVIAEIEVVKRILRLGEEPIPLMAPPPRL